MESLNVDWEIEGETPENLWDEWLWGSDPKEPCTSESLLNRNQLLGILVCRCKYDEFESNGGSRMSVKLDEKKHDSRLAIVDGKICDMTYCELRDTLSNAQIELPSFIQSRQKKDCLEVKQLIDECAARFGCLCEHCWDSEVLNDPMDSEPSPDGLVLRVGAMRRIIGSLLILYRHIYLLAVSKIPPKDMGRGLEVRPHHHEASMSNFYEWFMHYQLPVAGKLNYMHDFRGKYHHVSQPVYFHNPDFQRILRKELGEKGDVIDMIPSLHQMYPDVEVKFEEDFIDPSQDKGWYWLIVSGRVYMVGGGHVWYSDDAKDLMALAVVSSGL